MDRETMYDPGVHTFVAQCVKTSLVLPLCGRVHPGVFNRLTTRSNGLDVSLNNTSCQEKKRKKKVTDLFHL